MVCGHTARQHERGRLKCLSVGPPCACYSFVPKPPRRSVPLHAFVPGERNAAVCGGTDCGQHEDSSVHAVVQPGGGRTVSEGPEQGEVCVGQPIAFHRPAVRGDKGRCFICEPTTVPEAIDMAEVCEEVQPPCSECGHMDLHDTGGIGVCRADDCGCDGASELDGPECLSPYSIRYAVEGGQQYSLMLPGGTSVTIEDGIVQITHARPALAIVAVHT